MKQNKEKQQTNTSSAIPQNKQEEQKNITFQPFLQISRSQTIVITRKKVQSLPNSVKESQENAQASAARDKTGALSDKQTSEINTPPGAHNEIGLDCSGQGECQPGIVPSDSDEMQNFLLKKRKEVNKRTNAKKQDNF